MENHHKYENRLNVLAVGDSVGERVAAMELATMIM